MLNLPLVFRNFLSLHLKEKGANRKKEKSSDFGGVQKGPRRLPPRYLQSSEQLQQLLQRGVLATGEALPHPLVLSLQAAVSVRCLFEELSRRAQC